MAPELGDMVARGLAPMTAAGFLKELTEDVERDVVDHVVGVERLRVVTNESLQPLAFLASKIVMASIFHPNDIALYHLGGMIVDGIVQNERKGLALLRDELEKTGATHLGFHTQNAHALRLGETVAKHDFSLSSALATDLDTRHPDYQIVDGRSMVVDVGRYPIGGLYGDGGRFKYKKMQIPRLNTRNGDAVVFVGRVR